MAIKRSKIKIEADRKRDGVLFVAVGSTADWTDYPLPLGEGEMGWDTVTRQLKIGNGVDLWVALAPVNGGGGGGSATWGEVVGTLSSQTDLQSALNAKAATSHTHPLSQITSSGAISGQVPQWTGTAWMPATISGGGGSSNTFETVNKNLSALGATISYTGGGDLLSVVYSNGVTKTFTYGVNGLSSVVLSGATPVGIQLTKTLNYTSGELTGWSYS